MGRLFLLFAIVPVLEIFLLIRIGENIGTLNTIGIVIVTAMIGSYLAKTQGFSILNKVQQKLSTAQVPTNELIDGAIVLVCAALLLTPGVLTDIVGFLGLIPITRAPIRAFLKSKFANRVKTKSFQSFQTSGPQTWEEMRGGLNPKDEGDITDLVQKKSSSSTDELD